MDSRPGSDWNRRQDYRFSLRRADRREISESVPLSSLSIIVGPCAMEAWEKLLWWRTKAPLAPGIRPGFFGARA